MKSVIGMGNALTDILVNLKSEYVIEHHSLSRGGMTLMDSEKQLVISEYLTDLPQVYSLGGSASNTIRALAKLGITTGYIGKVGKDKTGIFFEQTLRELEIKPFLLRGESDSGRCISMVSNCGERTLCTYLGAARELCPDEIGPEMLEGFDYLYLEGYLVQDHELILRAATLAKAAGLQVVLDLASYNVVEENHDFLAELVAGHVDILFANEQEAFAFTGERNPLEALDKIARNCSLAVIKAGIKGSYVKQRGKVDHVGILVAPDLVDTTGAGDYYAAGFLYGLCNGLSMLQCGTIGAITSGKVVGVMGTTMNPEHWDEVGNYIRNVEQGVYIF